MDFSLTTLFVMPSSQGGTLPSVNTEALTPGQIGIYDNTYTPQPAGVSASAPYMYIAQGRANTYRHHVRSACQGLRLGLARLALVMI